MFKKKTFLSIVPKMPKSFSFASKISTHILGMDDDDDVNDPPLSPSLFSASSSSLVADPTQSPSLSSPSTSSPVYFSTPKAEVPGTQSFLERLIALRDVHDDDHSLIGHLKDDQLGARAQPPAARPRVNIFASDEEDDDDSLERPKPLLLSREVDELKSENVALQLQHEDDQREIARLRQQHEADRREIGLLRNLQQHRQQQPITGLQHPSLPSPPSQKQQPNPSLPPLPPPPPPPPLPLTLPPGWKRNKKKKKKKNPSPPATAATTTTTASTAATATIAATTARPTVSLPRIASHPPAPLSLPPPTLPTVFLFHDSNLKNITPTEIKNSINSLNNGHSNYNYCLHETYTLPQTFDKIRQTRFNKHDIVVINTLTNDARQTKNRQARTPAQAKNIQINIINYLKTHISPENLIILESPPLHDTPNSDIFPFNKNSFDLSRHHGIRFAETLIGEFHLFTDGYHVQRSARHLLVKSVAAAIANLNPHRHFGFSRPPHGNFGPWTSPNGQGQLPPTYRGAAMSRPINFRHVQIRPLMNINFQRSR